MGSKILITSPYPGFTALAKQICQELDVQSVFVEGVLDYAANEVKRLVENDKDIVVIVSRSGTASAIKEIVTVPVITAGYSDFDLLQSLWKGKKLGSKIGFLGYGRDKEDYDFTSVEEILGVEVKKYLFGNSFRELEQQIEKAYRDGMEVVVTGSSNVTAIAESKGMYALLIYSSRRTIARAIQRAKEIMEIRDRDRQNAERLKTILDFAHEGIAAVDQNNLVTVFNPIAEKLFKIDKQDIIGQTLENFSHNRSLTKVFGGGQPKLDDLQEIEDANVVVNRAPIHVGDVTIGMVVTFQEITQIQQMEHSIRRKLHKHGLVAKFGFEDIISVSKIMDETIQRAKHFGKTDSTILITGESGTGKELFAQSIHRVNRRREGPFVAVNCAALSESLLESELFGYEDGAFTGAKKGGKLGLFELAHGGTIFLDEIGKISLDIQSRLLRVLQEKEVMRVGGHRIIPVDVRVVAATNYDLAEAVEKGSFREDLFYRLNVLSVVIPPLRLRKQDVPPLIQHFLNKYNTRYGKKVEGLSPRLMEWFISYNWPGNVRELENFIERLVILADSPFPDNLQVEPLMEDPKETLHDHVASEDISMGDHKLVIDLATLEEMENEIVKQLLVRTQGNKSELAKILRISRTTLWKKLKRQNL